MTTSDKPLLKVRFEDAYIEMPANKENWLLIREFIDSLIKKRLLEASTP